MKLRTTAFLAVLGSALAACVTVDSGEPMTYARKCASSPCDVSVSTGNFGIFWQTVTLTDRTLDLNGQRSIKWTVTESGYQFADNGISFVPKPGGRDPGGVFACVKSADSLSFTCNVTEPKTGYYGYTVRLVGPADVLPYEAWIKLGDARFERKP